MRNQISDTAEIKTDLKEVRKDVAKIMAIGVFIFGLLQLGAPLILDAIRHK